MAKADNDKAIILSKNLFPVIGIGASAGGLDAFKKLVQAVPEKSGMAYIFVQHLHPTHPSALTEIIKRETTIPVIEISDNEEVKPDTIYIIPANKILVATDGILQLSPRPLKKDLINMPIDIFFSSLAEVHQGHSIGIVLSGTGTDGTSGLKKIKDMGGITFAQSPETASYDAMPQNAIHADVVDFILPPEKMPQQLLDLNRTFDILPLDDEATPQQLTEVQSYKQILALLRTLHGVDFTFYKQTTIRRRMLRRLALLKIEKLTDYHEYLKSDKHELESLFQDMLIPVTNFFRDREIFANLSEKVFPEIIKNKSATHPLRIWIPACSTGEEAYSMGMCLHEVLSENISMLKIQIFATDISLKSIDKARKGTYNTRELAGVSSSRLQQFFTKSDGNYHIKKHIRDMCVFAQHNFLKDPPFARIDLVSCRNALIYLEPYLQKKALAAFHYALNERGYLLLGKSETTGSFSDFFIVVGKREKLYLKRSFSGKFMKVTSERNEEAFKDKDYSVPSNERKKDDFQKNADNILLAKYMPPSVIVNEQFDIVQFRGSTREFLEPAIGKASLSLLKMANEGLSFELRNGLTQAKSTKEPFIKEGIPIAKGNRFITIEVIPLLDTTDLHFLVLFKDTVFVGSVLSDSPSKKGDKRDETTISIEQLTGDLLQAREDMRTIAEDQEAANEELQSANEELLSGSEELQSLNEELETSKEELQSTNEELITVNHELFDRNEEYNRARIYAESVVSTISEPLLVLSRDFKIRSANKSFYKTFLITEEETIGKVLFELQNNQWDIPGLHDKLNKIQNQQEKSLEWETTHKFPVIGERTICYNAQPVPRENGDNWILLALDDLTDRKNIEKIVTQNSEDVKLILESQPQIAYRASTDGLITYFNNFFLNYSGMSLNQALGSGWHSAVAAEEIDEVCARWNRAMASGDNFEMELRFKRKSDEMYRWHMSRALPIKNKDGIITSWVGGATDIHDHKTKAEAKDEFIGIASHELKTPITSAKAYIQMLGLNLEEKNDIENILFAQKAEASINKVNELIDELLDVSKIQKGKLNLKLTTFNFNEMLAEAREQVQFVSPSHSIIMSGEVDQPVRGDKQRLQQVVINLLTNAVKYSPDAEKVMLHADRGKTDINVSVTDFGIGIQKGNFNKIFERYFREDDRDFRFQGLGIGLSISYEIIERHGGRMWVESEMGKGSTFYFIIPL